MTESSSPAENGPGGSGSAVSVRRSGGFIGRTVTGEVDLEADDPRAPEVRDLLGRVDLGAVERGTPYPDMYSYEISVPGSAPVRVPEHHLTDDLRRLVDLLLSDPSR